MFRTAAIAAVTGALLAAPAASSAFVRIGETADQPDMGQFAGNYCDTAAGTSDTFATTQIPGPLQASSPIDGVIVRWRIRRGAGGPPLTPKLRVLQPGAAPGQLTGAGTGPQEGPVTDLGSFTARLPIKAGDYIGVDIPCDPTLANRQTVTERFYPGGGANVGIWQPFLSDGGIFRSPSFNDVKYSVVMDADIEPDADHDGYGDETQDGCPTQAVTHGACITTPPPITDKTPPKARAFFKSHDGLHHVVTGGLRGAVRSSEAGSAVAVAYITRQAAGRLHLASPVAVARGKATIASPGTVTIRLKFRKSFRKKLGKAHKLLVRVRVVVKDNSGNATLVKRNVVLKG